MKRRELVNWMGISAIAASLPVAIAACAPKPSERASSSEADLEASDNGPNSFVPVGTLTDLAQQGYLSNSDALDEPIVVIEDPTNPDALIALSAKCTHTGCTVAWQEDLFACPCHGSKFNPDGSVVTGPAAAPLTQYAAKMEGDAILVALR